MSERPQNEGRYAHEATDPTDWTDQERSFFAAGFNYCMAGRAHGEPAAQSEEPK